MQTYTRITNEFTGVELPGKIDENLQSLKSHFSGTAFPTENLVVGMSCYRTDEKKVYRLMEDLVTWKLESDLNYANGVPIATQSEAEKGEDDTKSMTPLKVKQSILRNVPTPETMTGASDTSDGLEGFVPAPKAGDNKKVLHGDGLWKKAIGFESYWEANEAVKVGDIRLPYGRENSGYVLECVKAGTTGENQPVISEEDVENAEGIDLDDLNGVVPIEKGGTGATTASEACANIGALPLTGGVIRGVLTKNSTEEELNLCGGTNYENGAAIALYGGDCKTGYGQGAFLIRACTPEGSVKDLIGRPDGTFTWGNNQIVTLTDNIYLTLNPANNGKTSLYKNASPTADYGFRLNDDNARGDVVGIGISAEQQRFVVESVLNGVASEGFNVNFYNQMATVFGGRVLTGNYVYANWTAESNVPFTLPSGGTWKGIWVNSISNNNYCTSGAFLASGGSTPVTSLANTATCSIFAVRVA